MRAPFQVLVIPFRWREGGLEFALLKRRDAGYWQFVAGGGEEGETPLEAAERETLEETRVVGEIIRLDSTSSVPRTCFAGGESWGEEVYVIPEYSFGVEICKLELRLSSEHTELRWAPYEEARRLLKWDSNRTALWELCRRLERQHRERRPGRGNGSPDRREGTG
jgi:dATP pyrophosphohydrolase